ncbi:uncharacterized protein LOC122075278 [Macadamia integrifolia]|uniref:uncharacterized protein LOC122075278 n=1 Tax=Macadamia integrifolia TaxID=60698 RepID=UPI001C4F69A4|nr:uncharacterized protein LOC122075278 [Macadamia integrifolia]
MVSSRCKISPMIPIFKSKRISAHLRRINKPSVKTIQSPDGDLIDCVPLHLQPAFDHPELKGQKPLDQPERPKGYEEPDSVPDSFQLWTNSGELCPGGTIPIRRTKEEDILRARSIRRFGSKGPTRPDEQ